jgi:putative membrane protein
MLTYAPYEAPSITYPAQEPIEKLTNKGEEKQFIKTALAWNGSVTPRVLPRVLAATLYALATLLIPVWFPQFSISITPFEYSGAVLGLLLVLRVNSGMDRWWEARKIWGSIVNQSRNLAIVVAEYRGHKDEIEAEFLRWVAAWPHVMRQSLRRETSLLDAERLLGNLDALRIRSSEHMPTYVGSRIARLLSQMRKNGLDDFAFLRAEDERSQLIDAIGACERIRNTPMPLVLAIKTRRFILLFLLLLPLALIDRVGWLTPLVVALAAYPLFSLDEIGVELQNPFSPRNLSHLPLTPLCHAIEKNVLGVGGKSGI